VTVTAFVSLTVTRPPSRPNDAGDPRAVDTVAHHEPQPALRHRSGPAVRPTSAVKLNYLVVRALRWACGSDTLSSAEVTCLIADRAVVTGRQGGRDPMLTVRDKLTDHLELVEIGPWAVGYALFAAVVGRLRVGNEPHRGGGVRLSSGRFSRSAGSTWSPISMH
jgi:hypothetical protein